MIPIKTTICFFMPIQTNPIIFNAQYNDDINKDRLRVFMPKEMKIPIEMGKENFVTVPKESMNPVK